MYPVYGLRIEIKRKKGYWNRSHCPCRVRCLLFRLLFYKMVHTVKHFRDDVAIKVLREFLGYEPRRENGSCVNDTTMLIARCMHGWQLWCAI